LVIWVFVQVGDKAVDPIIFSFKLEIAPLLCLLKDVFSYAAGDIIVMALTSLSRMTKYFANVSHD